VTRAKFSYSDMPLKLKSNFELRQAYKETQTALNGVKKSTLTVYRPSVFTLKTIANSLTAAQKIIQQKEINCQLLYQILGGKLTYYICNVYCHPEAILKIILTEYPDELHTVQFYQMRSTGDIDKAKVINGSDAAFIDDFEQVNNQLDYKVLYKPITSAALAQSAIDVEKYFNDMLNLRELLGVVADYSD
jgi:hypothetical protein